MAVIKSITLLFFVLGLCNGFFVPTQRYQSGVKSLNVVPEEVEGTNPPEEVEATNPPEVEATNPPEEEWIPVNQWDVTNLFKGETMKAQRQRKDKQLQDVVLKRPKTAAGYALKTFKLGFLYKDLKAYDQAAKVFEMSAALYTKALGAEDQKTKDALKYAKECKSMA